MVDGSVIDMSEHGRAGGVSTGQPFKFASIIKQSGEEVNFTEPTDIQLGEFIPLLRSILFAIANPSYVDKAANATRVQVQSGTVTTVTTVTNLTNFGTQSADVTFRINSNNAWANNVRRLIT
jgi:hypothetical protein